MTRVPAYLFALALPNDVVECYAYSVGDHAFVRYRFENVLYPVQAVQNPGVYLAPPRHHIPPPELVSDERLNVLVCQLSVEKKESELLSLNTVLRKVKLEYFLGAAD